MADAEGEEEEEEKDERKDERKDDDDEFVANEKCRRRFLRSHVRRELIQKLATGSQTLSQLRSQCKFVGYVSENDGSMVGHVIDSVLESIATVGAGAEGGGVVKYKLKAGLERSFDPTYWHRPRDDRQRVVEVMSERKRKRVTSIRSGAGAGAGGGGEELSLFPLVEPPPRCHPDLEGLRMLLFQPLLIYLVRKVVVASAVARRSR